jgi:3-deoxy-manno-octulosonate cytidylyltransferase (CMP-KDO synthetase)
MLSGHPNLSSRRKTELKPAVGIIPARWQSSRFPGKPLANILGKPMISMVYEMARQAESLERVIVATDDARIVEACEGLGIPVRMTSSAHFSGTERAAEVARGIDSPIVVNIQGDEPVLDPRMIDEVVAGFADESVVMTSLMKRASGPEAFLDPNKVKVVVDKNNDALYFSRAPIPHLGSGGFFQHVGIYGFRREFLFRFCAFPPSVLEKAESLEQLRALENGFRIRMIETGFSTLSVDTPRDIIEVERFLKEKKHD